MNKIILAMIFFAVLLSSMGKKRQDTPDQKSGAHPIITKGRSLLKDGDIVVRLNNSPASDIIRSLNQVDKSYSHAGVVLIENGTPMVYHMMPTENNRKGIIRKDSFEQLCEPSNNPAFGIYRFELRSNELAQIKIILQQWFEKQIAFDPLFDLLTDDRMYCSEMVAKLIAKATQQRLTLMPTTITSTELKHYRAKYHLPDSCGQGGKVFSIDNLYMNNFCKCVMKFNFEKSHS